MSRLKEYIEAGKIVTTQGLKGEVRCEAWCDDPALLTQVPRLCVGAPAAWQEVEHGRVQKGMVILKLRGTEDIDAAAKLRGQLLYLHREQIPLEAGEHLIQDLLGCEVLDVDSGKHYGKLCDVSKTGANDVYHIAFPDGSEKLIPAIPQVIIRVDVEEGRMEIRPLEGLFDL